MNSKVTHSPLLATNQVEADLTSLRRLLVAASISPTYCRALLQDPSRAIKDGFGGECFILSEPTLEVLSSIQAETLTDFIFSINEKIPILIH